MTQPLRCSRCVAVNDSTVVHQGPEGSPLCQVCGEPLCNRCKMILADSMSTITCYKESLQVGSSNMEVKETICWLCAQGEKMYQYTQTGEISSSLMSDAVMCRIHVEEYKDDFQGIRRDVAYHYRNYAKELVQIAHDCDEIHAKGREFEEKHWLPKLRKYWNDSTERGHGATTEDWKILMSGAAGRVLITLQDTKPQGQGKFGGAWITLIFDDSADYARGGIQGMCATKEEALGLIQAAIDNLPEIKADSEVHLLGT